MKKRKSNILNRVIDLIKVNNSNRLVILLLLPLIVSNCTLKKKKAEFRKFNYVLYHSKSKRFKKYSYFLLPKYNKADYVISNKGIDSNFFYKEEHEIYFDTIKYVFNDTSFLLSSFGETIGPFVAFMPQKNNGIMDFDCFGHKGIVRFEGIEKISDNNFRIDSCMVFTDSSCSGTYHRVYFSKELGMPIKSIPISGNGFVSELVSIEEFSIAKKK